MADRHGPLRTGRFQVEIDDVEIEGWRSVTIPSSSSTALGEGTFQDLEMKRGIQPGDTRLVDWRDEVIDGNEADAHKEVRVTLLDEEGEPQVSWEFTDAWIKYYNPPALDAAADGEVATETITAGFAAIEREEL